MKQEAIYARQSLDKKDSLSIETQIEDCKKKCKTNEPLVFRDKGFSGKNTERPDLKRLLKEIEQGKISKVIVYKLDRISRNITDFYNLYDLMQKHNCEFESVNENFDTSNSMGRAMMGILVVFAQMERENIQQRVKDNYYFRISDGRWAGGPAPFGFKNGRTTDNKPTLIVNEEEIKAIPMMFSMYANSPEISLQKLANYLYEKGFRSRKRERFDTITVARILQNPVYAIADERLYKYYEIHKINFINNKENWDGTTAAAIVGKKPSNSNIRKYTNLSEQSIYLTNFQGLIDSRTFIRVQERLRENKQIASANKEGTVLKELAGKLKCKNCGYAIKAFSKSTNGQPYLSCYNTITLHSCDVRFYNLKFVEVQEYVGSEIQKILDKMQSILEAKKKKQSETYQKIDEIKKSIDNLLDIASKTDNEYLRDDIMKKIENKEIERKELELQISMDVDVVDFIEINSKLSSAPISHVIYKDLSEEMKKAIVGKMIDKIFIDRNNNIEIIWKI